jgi:hypothetical protein
VSLAIAANSALVEGRLTDAAVASQQALARQAFLGQNSAWLAHNVAALAEASQGHADSAGDLLERMHQLSEKTGDPMPKAVALFDRALISSFSSEPAAGLSSANELLALGDQWESPVLRAMGLVSIGRVLATIDVNRSRFTFTKAAELAESVRCGLLGDQARRGLSELEASAGGNAAALPALQRLLERFRASGDLSQQLQTIVSFLEPLVALDAFEIATVLCGALSKTALGMTARCQNVLAITAGRMAPELFRAALERGASLSPHQLVTVATVDVELLLDQL